MSELKETKADQAIRACLDKNQSFAVVAGAGSGKTTSLVSALKYLRETKESDLRQSDRNIVCITYTNRAVEVISQRLEWDELFRISTIHNFLWESIKRFSKDIREALQTAIIPEQILKKQEDYNGGKSIKATTAREKIASLQLDIDALNKVVTFKYNDSTFSDYPKGLIGHDDVIRVAAHLIQNRPILRSIIGQKYPYIFVDEAQDTFSSVVEALNTLSNGDSLPVIGYFGDPMQQIYDKRAGDFSGSEKAVRITKEENFRCSPEVINLLNVLRSDVQQFPAGKNAEIKGSIRLYLVQAESPEAPRKRYSEAQLERASAKFDQILNELGWSDQDEVKHLFLVRQMIARRLGFSDLQNLFTGQFASTRAQEAYESGEHYLLKPFVDCLCDLIHAHRNKDASQTLKILRKFSPTFDPLGQNSLKAISQIQGLSVELTAGLNEIWNTSSIREILAFCHEKGLCRISDRLLEDLKRAPRTDEFDKRIHSEDKGEWLADAFFEMGTKQIEAYIDFVRDNTAYSTQHGVKGEEYRKVVTVFDDIEAAWSHYSFTKTLTPQSSGEATEGQNAKSTKLAYVCFSRAEVDLCIILFTEDPTAAKAELLRRGLFADSQVMIH